MKTWVYKCVLSILLFSIVLFTSCDDYLNTKSDQKLTTPTTLADLRAILDGVSYLNNATPSILEIGSDNIYLSDASWLSIGELDSRNAYLMNRQPVYQLQWAVPYRAVFYANTVLDQLDKVKSDGDVGSSEKKKVEGAAKFFRGLYFYQLAQVFGKSYQENHLNEKGIVLRLTSNINDLSIRSSIEETYKQIEKDLLDAVDLLPEEKQIYPTRPNKKTAYATLANFYLSKQDYKEAKKWVRLVVTPDIELLDFNSLNLNAKFPLERFNKEVIFYSAMTSDAALSLSRVRLSEKLYTQYAESDLRKTVYFTLNTDNTVSYKGDIAQNTAGTLFCGLTNAEMLLVLAEMCTRDNELEEARSLMVKLLKCRYRGGKGYTDLPTDQQGLLGFIISERQKELVFRGKRWTDMRRLAKDGLFEGLEREVQGDQIKLSAEEIASYAFLLPNNVIQNSSVEQN